ncbi:hypothetical protein ACHAXS_006335 [Conticribra weissflogii]
MIIQTIKGGISNCYDSYFYSTFHETFAMSITVG